MLPTFLIQLAGGSALVVACAPIRQVSWKYLRLMAVVCLALLVLAAALLTREGNAWSSWTRRLALLLAITAAALAVAWMCFNAVQGERIRAGQRLWPILVGAAAVAAAIFLVRVQDVNVIERAAEGESSVAVLAVVASTLLGALLLGTTTAAMLLGHRYLTDTGMTIAPLRRLAIMHLCVISGRALWVLAAAWPVCFGDFTPTGDYGWFWLMLSARVGVGIIAAGIFAWMAWDCVRRRATQSATAIFYLSMIFVFLGELCGQYLLRSQGLAM